jgi:CelD/BcsL family acetyltransferase involved in cellulose biosynthesis
MQFEVINDEQGFVALRSEWQALESRCGCHLFQSHRFLLSWLKTGARSENVRPALVLYREEGVLKAVFPTCLVRKMNVSFLTWMGGFYIIDYGDILFDPTATLPADDFVAHSLELLKEKLGFHLYYLHNVRSDAVVFPYLKRHFRPYRAETAPFVRLDGDFDSYFDSLKQFRKKMKSDTLRQIKRLSALGTLEFHIAGSSGELTAKVMRAFIEQKKWQYSTTGVAGVLFRPGYEEFYNRESRENPHAHVSCLLLNGAVIAVHFGYLYNNRMYYLMPSYDHRYGAYSPGRVLVYYLMQECYGRGVAVFDFSVGSEGYKYEWTRDDVPITSFVGNDIFGRAFVGIITTVKKIRKALASGKGSNESRQVVEPGRYADGHDTP